MSPRRYDNPSPDDLRREAREIQESGRTEGGKSPSRVAAGKKAAATRKEKGMTTTSIAAAFFASKLFGLKTLSWILDNFISSFLLIVIVVFQHDIRRGLSRVGRRTAYGAIGYGTGAYLVDELTRAAGAMAKDRIGAIIV